jgi:hypothetical protein
MNAIDLPNGVLIQLVENEVKSNEMSSHLLLSEFHSRECVIKTDKL